MKKQNFIKYFMLCLLLALSGTFLCSCEWLLDLFDPKPDAPVISINKDEKFVYWQVQNDTSIIKYELYINQNLVKSIDNISDGSTISCDFSEFLKSEDIYEINVCSVSDSHRSIFSNTISYVHGNEQEQIESPLNIITSPSLGVSNITKNGTVLKWDKVEYASKYIVLTFNNKDGYVIYETTKNFIDLYNVLPTNTPTAIKVASVFADDNNAYIKDNEIIYNLTYSESYGNNLYLFDGQLNDYYITSESELCNILYYNFIDRNEEYTIRLSEEYANKIISDSTKNESDVNKIRRKITETVDNYISETSVHSFYVYNNETEAFACNKANSGNYDYTVKIGFYGVDECLIDVDNFNTYTVTQSTQESSILPYYEIYDYSLDARDNNTIFDSDNNFFQVIVETSEELYWAVENNYTPICVENSRAELIYDLAKNILNDIIGNNMTDFEKALCIFDYICSTTTYDKRNFSQVTLLPSYKTTQIPSFYLEGVFLKGVAVCDGFSKAFSLLCNMEGLDCVRIVGSAVQYAATENHAWNKVKINGEWYLVDTTWGELSSGFTERLTHKYFLITDEMTKTSHIPNSNREKFFNYPTSQTAYDFYSNYKINHTYSDNTSISADLFISSDSELEKVVDYCLLNEFSYIELFMERFYVISELTPNANSSANTWIGKKISNLNFKYQFVTCYYSNNDYYTQSDISGCIVVLQIKNILTSEDDISSFVNYLSSEKLNNDYYFYLTENYLNSIYPLLDFSSKVQNLQNNYNNINFEYIGTETTYNSTKKAYLVKLTYI